MHHVLRKLHLKMKQEIFKRQGNFKCENSKIQNEKTHEHANIILKNPDMSRYFKPYLSYL